MVFCSRATNLVGSDTPVEDIFAAYELDSGGGSPGQALELDNMTLDVNGVSPDGDSTRAMVSTDGLYLTFTSAATNLDPAGPDTNGVKDVFFAELAGLNPAEIATIERIRAVDGSEGNGISETSDTADGGHTVVFESDATNLLGAGNDTNGVRDIFEWSETGLERAFRRGDANDDGIVDLSDYEFNLEYQFLGTVYPDCLDAADVDDSGEIDLTDPIYILDYLFYGTAPPPPAPYPDCGPDPTGDGLTCELSICED